MSIQFGREIAGDLGIAETREWLVTNGIGGYASGTVAGSITRGYHGLLVAAVHPPVDRRIMLVKLDEILTYRTVDYPLTSNRWEGGSVVPEGFKNIQSFELEGSVPYWKFACGDAILTKRIWMQHGENTTYVSYTLEHAAESVHLAVKALVDNRVFHNTGQIARPIQVDSVEDGVRIVSGGSDARPLVLRMANASVQATDEVYQNFYLPAEAYRGLRATDDHSHAATFDVTLAPGETVIFLASAEDNPAFVDDALAQRLDRDQALLKAWNQTRVKGAKPAPSWMETLVLAADQFVVDRPSANQPNGKSVIAGYHWFEDWGRDTMISLPGLTLVTGQAATAAPILRTFASFVSEGMLPNRFPDESDTPQYNTIDATLWYFQAIRAYHESTGDNALLRDLFPVLKDIIDWHFKGTRFGIKVDPADGLLYGGEPGVQLTWMDAIVNGQVITPRVGKPVEVNALWYNALSAMASFAKQLGKSPKFYQSNAKKTLAGFTRFWRDDVDYCFDVLDGPNGNETHLRPNQLFAVALPDSPLSKTQQRSVVDTCSQFLMASYGQRSLSPMDPAFQPVYGGDQTHRDSAYHQGTVWGWLIGPFITAHLRVYQDPAAALELLKPVGDQLKTAGLGTIGEVFDGDAPFHPRGCIAQAWSVAEAIRAFDVIERHAQK